MNKNSTKQELHDEVKRLRLQLTEKSESAQAMLLDNIMHSSTKMSVVATDIDLNVIFFSRRAEQIFGYKASDVIGKNLTEIHAMEKVKFSRIENAIKIIKKTGNYERLINQKTENGIRHLKLKASCILDKKENISGFVLLTTDETKEIIAEKKLQKSEKKFREVIDNAGDGILIGNKKGFIISANKSICELTGYTKSELTGKHIGFIFSKKMLEEEPLLFDELDKGETIIKERRIKGKKGNIIPIEMNSKRLDNKNYIAVFRDLTEREKTKTLIRKLSAAVKQSANSIVITNTDGNIEYTNPRFTELTGYTAEEVLGRNPRFLSTGELPKEHYIKLWKTITAEKIWQGEFHNEKKNGDYFWEQVTITPIKNESGKTVNYLAIKEDITARKKAEEALKENEEYFRTLIENSTDVISILDNKGNIMYESPAHKYILGYRKGELAGKNSFELVHPDDRDRILVQFTKLLKNPKNFENVNFRYLHKDGTWLHLEGTGKNLLNSPKINGIVVNYRDVSARKKAEQKLKRQNEEYASLNEEYLIQNEEIIKAKEKAEESEKKMRTILNSIPDVVLQLDTNLKILWANEAAIKLNPNATGHLCYKALSGRTTRCPNCPIVRALETGEIEQGIVHSKSLTGVGESYWDDIGIPVKDNQGKITGIIKISRNVTKKIQAEEEIRKLSQAVATTPQAIVIADLEGKIEYVNPGLLALSGYDNDCKIINKPIFLFTDREGTKQLKEEIIPMLLLGGQWNGEITIKRKNGSFFPAEMICSIIFDENKQPKYFLSHYNDITKRKQAKKELQESEEKLRTLYDSSSDAIMLLDEKGFFDCNNAALQLFGCTKREQFCSKHPSDFSPPTQKDGTDSMSYAKNNIRIALKKGSKRFEHLHRRLDGTDFPAEVLLDTMVLGGKKVLQARVYDITERKEAAESLRKSEEKYRLLANNTIDCIWKTDKNFKFTYINPSVFNMLGFTANEWIGSTLAEYCSEKTAQKIKTLITELIPNKQFSTTFEIMMFHKNGTEIPVEITGQILINENNEIIGFQGTTRDITERKLVEKALKNQNEEYATLNEEYATLNEEYKTQNEELIKAKEKAEESNRLKTEFINNMSHEIRTPMNGILGFSQLLYKRELTEEKRKHYINIIQNSGNKLMYIINNILEISKLGSKQIKSSDKNVCLNDLLLELFSNFENKAKENKTPLYLKKGLSDKKSTILTNPKILNKVLSSLLNNAIKFTNKGFIEFGYRLINNEIEIYIKDTGIGIRPEKQKIIFEPFSQEETKLTEKIDGLGLGLAIAKKNAELIDGEITLISEKGEGSTFFITIPYKLVYKGTIKELLSATKPIRLRKDEYTILIAEDEEVNYFYLETLLIDESELTCKMLHAKDGKETVKICKENSHIDLVLMDLKMPIMDGYEATRLIKEFCPDLPIVAQTAYSTTEEIDKAMSAGCDDFISKPISEEDFNEVINKYLIPCKI